MKIGFRTIKTVAAVFVCFLIDYLVYPNSAFFSSVAAILCIQKSSKDSLEEAKKREVGTIIGGLYGALFLFLENLIGSFSWELLRYLVISLMLIPIIQLSVKIKQDKGTFLMCVVFLSIVINRAGDANPLSFALERTLETSVGIAVALCISLIFPYNNNEENSFEDENCNV